MPWLILAALAAIAALAGWVAAARRAAGADEASAEREREHREVERLRRANEEQRRWNHELSAKLNELYRSEGVLGSRDDVRSLVLRVAMNLLEADKGLLLSREDADGDGNLDVVAHEGFSADPTESSLVQHFAGLVVEKDQIVRIGKDEMPESRPEDADEEIENLVAIPIYIADRFHGGRRLRQRGCARDTRTRCSSPSVIMPERSLRTAGCMGSFAAPT